MRKSLAILVVIILQVPFIFGQEMEGVEVYFENETVAVDKGTTFTNFLVIENSEAGGIIVRDIGPKEKYPGLIFYPKTDVTIEPGKKKRLILKFIANLDFIKMKSDSITFDFTITTSRASENRSASFRIRKEEETKIAIYPYSHENYINPPPTESSVLIFAENKGYSKRSIILDFQSLPNGLEITPRQQTLSLEGLEKRMIELKLSVTKQNTLFPDYNIQVKATDLTDNSKLDGTSVKVVVLSHNRQVIHGPGPGSGSNFAEMAFNEHSSGLSYTQFRGNMEFRATNDLRGRLNLTTDYYDQDGLYNLYDTWLELERENTLLRIGNLYGSDYDYSISGRGGQITKKIGTNKAIEVLALENNFNLYGTYFPQGEGAKIGGAKYSFGEAGTFHGKASYLFDHDPRLSINSHVAHFFSSFTLDNRHHFRLETGLSNEKGLLNKDRNNGVSAGLNYNAKIGKWSFHSLNSYGTKSYAGLNRGAFLFNQRIGRDISDNKQVFVLYQHSQVQPEYLSFQSEQAPPGGIIYPAYFHSSQAFKTGYQFSTSGWNFLISPQVEQQKSTLNIASHELLAYRFLTNMGKSFGSHGLHLTTEYSYSTADRGLDWFHGFRADMLYLYRSFSLNSSAQWNPTNVIDLNSWDYDEKNFVNYNFYAAYNFQTLNHTLTGFASAGINYSGLYQYTNNYATVNVEYKFLPGWSVTGYFNYSQYGSIQTNGYKGDNYQFRVGMKKYFRIATSTGNHKVRFLLFEDDNFNGQLDKDETVLPNEVVRLDDHIAITGKDGKVTFQNVPTGDYTLRVNESAGARMMMDPVIRVDKKMDMEVGLVKKVRVTGKFSEVRQPYDELNTDVTGVLVYARNQKGLIQTAVVNQNKEFEFYLQEGFYDIYIKNDKYDYINSLQTIKVTKNGKQKPLLFEYKKKDINIKIKKF